jgi:hypothetical protein
LEGGIPPPAQAGGPLPQFLWNLKRKAHQFVLAWHLFLLIGSLSSIYWNNMSWQDQVVPLILNGTIALYLFACNSFWANEQYEKGLSYES